MRGKLKIALFPAIALVLLIALSCAGGSLFRPRPLIGKDRLVYRVQDQPRNETYFTRNVWFDGDNYRFHDVYGRELSLPRSDSVLVELIGPEEYYRSP